MRESQWTIEERARHWDAAYGAHGVNGASWYQAAPSVSLGLIEALGVGRDAAIVDVGGGTSTLAERLIGKGYRDVHLPHLDPATDAVMTDDRDHREACHRPEHEEQSVERRRDAAPVRENCT